MAQDDVSHNPEEFKLKKLLFEGLTYFQQSSISGLRQVGSILAEQAYLNPDSQLVNASAIFYSLGKFLEKSYIQQSPSWLNFHAKTLKNLQEALDASDDFGAKENLKLASSFERMLSDCDEVSELLGRFHVSAVEKARVKIAADFYARGASLGTSAALTGADKAALLSYIGATRIVDKYETISVATRLKAAESLFNG